MASNKYPHLQNQCEHLIRGIPNNILTRWIVKRINIWMKKSDSRHRLHRRYRTPRKGGYTMYGETNKENELVNKHKVSYLLKSEKKCISCGCRLKINLVKKKPTAKECYKCYKARTVKIIH